RWASSRASRSKSHAARFTAARATWACRSIGEVLGRRQDRAEFAAAKFDDRPEHGDQRFREPPLRVDARGLGEHGTGTADVAFVVEPEAAFAVSDMGGGAIVGAGEI